MSEILEEVETEIPPPEEWQSANAPMTTKQRDYLSSLARQLGIIFDDDLTKAEAAQAIDHFKSKLKKRWRKAKSEPMTAGQKRYLQFLCKRSGRDFDPKWTKVQASSAINLLLGRGQNVPEDLQEEEARCEAIPNLEDDSDFLEAFVDEYVSGQRGRKMPEY